MEPLFYLIPLFLLISIIYSSAGFGGGSSYVAVLALFAFPYTLIPKVSLLCNIIVVSGGCYIFYKAGHLKISRIWPFILGSIPMSFIGGQIHIKKEIFLLLLAVSLVVASTNLLFFNPKKKFSLKLDGQNSKHITARGRLRNIPKQSLESVIIGGILGLISGLVGIGGGIFLSPLLLIKRWGKAKEIAATASFFILINSFAGLIGQFSKTSFSIEKDILFILPLALTVMIGGQIGSRMSAFKLPDIFIKRTTGVIVMVVGIRILIKLSISV